MIVPTRFCDRLFHPLNSESGNILKQSGLGNMPYLQENHWPEVSTPAADESRLPEKLRVRNTRLRSKKKAALVTPCLSHLPFHPSCFLGYGTAILAEKYDLEVFDLNADLHFRNWKRLKPILEAMDKARTVSDAMFLYPFYDELEPQIDKGYAAISWERFPLVFVTAPSWFPTITTEAVLRLARAIKWESPETRAFFFSNSLGSWTSEGELRKNGVDTVHLNDLFGTDPSPSPVRYDLLPTPVFENRGNYLFDLIPFMLKHGCGWGQCRFCSLCRGWNAGYLERSARSAITELEVLIDRYNPAALVCRDHSMNGHNLVEFCGYLERFKKPWGGMARGDLSKEQIEALSKAGCRAIFFGLESGSDRTLQAINKGITSKQMSDFIKRLHSLGILPAPSLMIGTPGERTMDLERTIRFLEDHRGYLKVVNLYPFMATPAAEFAPQRKQPDSNGLRRIFKILQRCEDLGLKVCLGEQSMEYFLFKWVYSDRPATWGGRGFFPSP